MTKKSLQTTLIHSDYTPPEGFAAFPPAIHHASTVLFKNVAAMRSGDWKDKNAYTYGLHGTPTTFTLEARLAAIEGGTHCLLAPSRPGGDRHGRLRAAENRRRRAAAG